MASCKHRTFIYVYMSLKTKKKKNNLSKTSRMGDWYSGNRQHICDTTFGYYVIRLTMAGQQWCLSKWIIDQVSTVSKYPFPKA